MFFLVFSQARHRENRSIRIRGFRIREPVADVTRRQRVTRGGLRRLRRAPYAAVPSSPRSRLPLFDGYDDNDDDRLATGQRQAAVQGMVLLTAPIKYTKNKKKN